MFQGSSLQRRFLHVWVPLGSYNHFWGTGLRKLELLATMWRWGLSQVQKARRVVSVQSKKRSKILGLLVVALIIAGCFSTQLQNFIRLPNQQKISVGDELTLGFDFPRQALDRLSVYVEARESGVFKLNGNPFVNQAFRYNQGVPVATEPGQVNIYLKLFGFIPLKSMTVDVVPKLKLIPGGQSIGVMLNSQGVMIVGFSPVIDKSGVKHYPAKDAGIKVGDTVLKINGQPVNSDHEMAGIIKNTGADGGELKVLIKRDNRIEEKVVKPVLCKETGSYRIGLYIRDSAAGVGTLTFIDPDNLRYGALGHVITDADTGQKINLRDGKIVKASVQGIKQGKKGIPGEKIGMFLQDGEITGNIRKNTQVGIFGTLDKLIKNPFFQEPVPVALSSQVKTGPAEILTVIDGTKIEKFNIEIQRVLPYDRPDAKGMIIKVTDRRLLARTGGIIQGMSGSPILQDNKIIGAVTHVFVNDPTRGYGVYIEKMINETQQFEYRLPKAG